MAKRIAVILPDGVGTPPAYTQIRHDIVMLWLNAQNRYADMEAYEAGNDSYEDEAELAGMSVKIIEDS